MSDLFAEGLGKLIRIEKLELISEFLEDLKLTHPMIGFKYTRLELIKKWEERLPDATGREVL